MDDSKTTFCDGSFCNEIDVSFWIFNFASEGEDSCQYSKVDENGSRILLNCLLDRGWVELDWSIEEAEVE